MSLSHAAACRLRRRPRADRADSRGERASMARAIGSPPVSRGKHRPCNSLSSSWSWFDACATPSRAESCANEGGDVNKNTKQVALGGGQHLVKMSVSEDTLSTSSLYQTSIHYIQATIPSTILIQPLERRRAFYPATNSSHRPLQQSYNFYHLPRIDDVDSTRTPRSTKHTDTQ